MPLFDLTNRVALVSGAASGLGRASSLALAEHGADLLLVDLNTEGCERTAQEVRQLGRRAIVATRDVSRPELIRQLFSQLDDEFGRVDFLANIAGEAVLGKPEEISLEAVEQVWRN